MNSEQIFRFIFFALWIVIGVIRGYYARRVRLQGGRMTVDREAVKHEGRMGMGLRLSVTILIVGTIALYAFVPDRIARLRLPFPDWLHWFGAGLGILSLPLMIWVHRARSAGNGLPVCKYSHSINW
ncbi:MAG: hypothetical protein M1546_26705 [Chloroflexi bacterium]|nr:hypothetical protein [Chloroflexota bacterium]